MYKNEREFAVALQQEHAQATRDGGPEKEEEQALAPFLHSGGERKQANKKEQWREGLGTTRKFPIILFFQIPRHSREGRSIIVMPRKAKRQVGSCLEMPRLPEDTEKKCSDFQNSHAAGNTECSVQHKDVRHPHHRSPALEPTLHVQEAPVVNDVFLHYKFLQVLDYLVPTFQGICCFLKGYSG